LELVNKAECQVRTTVLIWAAMLYVDLGTWHNPQKVRNIFLVQWPLFHLWIDFVGVSGCLYDV